LARVVASPGFPFHSAYWTCSCFTQRVMGGVKRIPQVARVSTVNIRLQPWAQQLEETAKPPKTASQSTRSETVPLPGSHTVRKIPNPSHQKGQQALVEQTGTKSSWKVAKAPGREPTEQEILTAMESLYDDELKPYGRLLRKRFTEHLEAAGGKVEDVDLGHIRVVCESSTRLSMESEAGGEWSALLRDRDPVFVDFYSLEDPFPETLWSQVAAHFAQLTGEENVLPGGRYACAQALVQLGVAFIRGMSLGQVCHLVQLALGNRKILGYKNGTIAPYGQSHSRVKDSAAAQQSSCTLAAAMHGASELQVATWETARDCLRKILEAATASGRDSVPLSNIKRLFRSRFSVELSETTFGHARLTDLLNDATFRDICTVQLLDRGYVVCPVPRSSSDEVAQAHAVTDDHERIEPSEGPKSLPQTSYCSRPTFESRMCALSPSTLAKDGPVGCMVHNTFIHASGPPPTPIRSSCRSSSLPKDIGSARSAWEASCHALSFRSRSSPTELQVQEDIVPQLLSPTLTASPSMSPAPYHTEGLMCQGTQLHCSNGYGIQEEDVGAFSDLSACLMGQLLEFPWANGDLHGGMDCALTHNSCLEAQATVMQEPHTRVKFCPDEPLCLDEEDSSEAAKPSKECAGLAQKRPALTPSTLRKSGFVVQNTFINSVSVPPTPIPGAMRRSSSMPCVNHALDDGESEVHEVSSKHFPFPGQPWSYEAAADCSIVTSPALTASPMWSPQPRRGQLDLSGSAPCAPLVVRISDFL